VCEVVNLVKIGADGEHAREVDAKDARLFEIAHGGNKIATDGGGG
jgi:hypothetical protein